MISQTEKTRIDAQVIREMVLGMFGVIDGYYARSETRKLRAIAADAWGSALRANYAGTGESAWPLIAEYADAALDVLANGVYRPCDDCGEPTHTRWADDTNVTCAECGDGRMFHRGQGPYYDAFA